jgi:hypothetical protein
VSVSLFLSLSLCMYISLIQLFFSHFLSFIYGKHQNSVGKKQKNLTFKSQVFVFSCEFDCRQHGKYSNNISVRPCFHHIGKTTQIKSLKSHVFSFATLFCQHTTISFLVDPSKPKNQKNTIHIIIIIIIYIN